MNKTIFRLHLAFFCICLSVHAYAQVGVGTTSPNASSILEINSTTKGVLLPSVNLTSNTMDLDANGSTTQPVGLLVYNNGSTLTKGYYFWNGTEWRILSNDVGVSPQVSSINCSNAELSPSKYTANTAYTGVLTIPYTGGNGGTYPEGNAVISNGLTFKLQPDKLINGNGFLTFNVSGTPTNSSPTASTITINSSSVPFYSGTACTVTVGDVSIASIDHKSIISGFSAEGSTTNSQSEFLTIGNFSFRFYFSSGTANAYYSNLVNTQIRNNSASTVSIYNYSFAEYFANAGITTYGTISLASGVWTNIGETGVLYDVSEKRQYMITPVSNTDKTAYRVEFLLAGSASSDIRNNAKAIIFAEYLNNN